MNLNTKPSKVLNPAYRKFKPLRKDVNLFKEQLTDCLNHIKINEEQNESEENIKKYIGEFLQNTFYQDHLINTKDRIDLAIYLGKNAKSKIGVLLEAKKPSNSAEFLRPDNINKKALQELLLYYLRERVNNENNNIKHLIATNGFEWYLFKGEDFYDYFYKNKKLLKEFKEFDSGKKDSSKTELFYKEIAAKYIAAVEEELPFLHINLKDYEQLLDLSNTKDKKLTALYKVFSPVHLLGESFGNDSNQLNKQFYYELLHIIGLEEVKEKGKKVIQRKAKGKRNYGSLLESTIFTLDDRDYLRKVDKLSSFGKTREEQLFNVGLELCLSWINRILFLKLLEAQLLDFHKDDPNYKFLHSKFISGFDDLEELFFSALAKEMDSRSERLKERYQYIPYLNSSLFEPTELEETALQISNVKDEDLELYEKTILKDEKHKRLSGKLNTLEYLFRFLDAYDFSTESSEEVEESNQSKSLISASVLGLIFEKINGYKDGSFYTPAYITMYMSRETLRRAVIQKFNEHYNWKCQKFRDLKEDLKDHIRSGERNQIRIEANEIINSLKICDPAVGSGHFLVSALNELIAIKSELGILVDAEGERLNTYIHLDNDELIIEDENEELFQYKPEHKNAQNIQKALFHEKQNLIENCLFGVDINPNSVKICRLRLWIELLKNAYYTEKGQLQTLPNIDINIKAGNSLISRFELDDNLKSAFRSKENPYSLQDYKQAVADYKQTNDKYKKREILQIIDTVKSAFKDSLDSKFLNKLSKTRGKYEQKQTELQNLQAFGEKISKKEKDALKKLKKAFDKAEAEKEEILNNVIYQNAFEWRFEFPEVLDEEGNFRGFDVVIGNPPYIRHEEIKWMKPYLKDNYEIFNSYSDILTYFIERSHDILKQEGLLQFIISGKFARASYGEAMRTFLSKKTKITHYIDFAGANVFDEATVDALILGFEKIIPQEENTFIFKEVEKGDPYAVNFKSYIQQKSEFYAQKYLGSETWGFESPQLLAVISKLQTKGVPLAEWDININRGVLTGYNGAFLIDETTKNELIEADSKAKEIIHPLLRGRDIGKYANEAPIMWLIGTHNGIKNTKDPIDINLYPSIKEHLDKDFESIQKRADQGDTPYNLRNCAYWFDFAFPKLVWKRIGSILRFSYDESGAYCLDSTCIATGEKVKFLCAVLNSTLCNKELFRTAPKTGTGDLIISVQALTPLHIPIPSEKEEQCINTILDQILSLKKEDPQADSSALEQEIDVLVYRLYGLTYEEVLVVDEDFEEVMGEEAYAAVEL